MSGEEEHADGGLCREKRKRLGACGDGRRAGDGTDRQPVTIFLWVLSAVLSPSEVGEERFGHNWKLIKILRPSLLRSLARYK